MKKKILFITCCKYIFNSQVNLKKEKSGLANAKKHADYLTCADMRMTMQENRVQYTNSPARTGRRPNVGSLLYTCFVFTGPLS